MRVSQVGEVILVIVEWFRSLTAGIAACRVLVPILIVVSRKVCFPAVVTLIPGTVSTSKIALLPYPGMAFLMVVSLVSGIEGLHGAAFFSAFVERRREGSWRGLF